MFRGMHLNYALYPFYIIERQTENNRLGRQINASVQLSSRPRWNSKIYIFLID